MLTVPSLLPNSHPHWSVAQSSSALKACPSKKGSHCTLHRATGWKAKMNTSTQTGSSSRDLGALSAQAWAESLQRGSQGARLTLSTYGHGPSLPRSPESIWVYWHSCYLSYSSGEEGERGRWKRGNSLCRGHWLSGELGSENLPPTHRSVCSGAAGGVLGDHSGLWPRARSRVLASHVGCRV